MANKYNDILTITANGKNQMGLSNTIKRDYGIPLDFTSVQADFAAAVEYAATSTLAYVGQPISVGDKLYIITAESQGKYPAEVEEGGSQQDVFLAEVGSATEGDGNTIELDGQTLKLAGLKGLDNSKTYVPSLVNGKLVWAEPDTSTAEGQAQEINALKTRAAALEATVNGVEASDGVEAQEGLVTKVADNAKAIDENAAAIENITKADGAIATAIAGEAKAREDADKVITDLIGDVAEDKTVVEMIAEVEAKIPTDNASLTNGAGYQTAANVASAIENKADKADTLAGYGIGDAYTKDEINNFLANITHFTTEIVESTDAVTKTSVLYLIKDETVTGSDKYNEYIFVEGTGAVLIGDTTTDLSDYVTNDALTTALAPYAKTADVVAKTAFETFQGENTIAIGTAKQEAIDAAAGALATYKGEVTTALGGKVDNATLDNYYNKTQTDALLDTKADAEDTTNALATKIEGAQIRHTSEGVGEGVEKSGTQLTITVDAYTKSEVYTKSETDAAITTKINSVTGGESAADVKLALEDYRDAVNAEIWGENAKAWTVKTTGEDGKVTVTYTPQYGSTSRVDALENNVATLVTNVGTAQTTADEAKAAIAALEGGQVKTNKESIAALAVVINGTDSNDKNSISYRVGALETANTNHATEFATLTGKVDQVINNTIPAINNLVAANDTAIKAINTTLNGTEAVGEEGQEGYIPATEGLIAAVAKKAEAANVYSKTEIDGKVEVINGEIAKKADQATTYTKTEVDNLLANLDQTELENGIAANKADIAVLVGDDKDAEGKATKSVRAIAKEEVAAVVGAAPEAMNTLEEVANWIANDESGAAAMSSAIAGHSAILAGFGTGEDETATVAEAIAAAKQEAIDAIPALEAATANTLGGIKSATGDNKVTVDADGVASVASVNVNSLVQSTDTILVLDGGHA